MFEDRDWRLKWVGEQMWGKKCKIKNPSYLRSIFCCAWPAHDVWKWKKSRKLITYVGGGEERKKEVSSNRIDASNKIRTESTKLQILPRFTAIFLFAKMQSFFCKHLWVDFYVCFVGLVPIKILTQECALTHDKGSNGYQTRWLGWRHWEDNG